MYRDAEILKVEVTEENNAMDEASVILAWKPTIRIEIKSLVRAGLMTTNWPFMGG